MKKLDGKFMTAVAAGLIALGGGLHANEAIDEELLSSPVLGDSQDLHESLMDINDQQNDEDYLAFWWLWEDDEGPNNPNVGSKEMPTPLQAARKQVEERTGFVGDADDDDDSDDDDSDDEEGHQGMGGEQQSGQEGKQDSSCQGEDCDADDDEGESGMDSRPWWEQ